MNNLMTQEQLTDLAISTESRDLIRQGVASNTIKAYQTAMQKLAGWLGSRGLTDTLLAAYITDLHTQGKAPTTIGQVVAAVRWQAKHLSIDEDFSLPITTHTLASLRREGRGRGRGQVEGLTWRDVERVTTFAEADKTVTGLRDSAMILLMSDGLLRVSEVVGVNVGDLNKTTLTVRSSKTNQEEYSEDLHICESTYRVIKRYLTKANITQGALFRQIRRGDNVQSDRLTDFSARRIIQKRASAAGVKGFISGHSLRVGSAVSLAQAGASVVDMQVVGRWKSAQMPVHYTKAELAKQGAIARFRYGKEVRQMDFNRDDFLEIEKDIVPRSLAEDIDRLRTSLSALKDRIETNENISSNIDWLEKQLFPFLSMLKYYNNNLRD